MAEASYDLKDWYRDMEKGAAMRGYGLTREHPDLGLQWYAGETTVPGLGQALRWSSNPLDAINYGTLKDAQLVAHDGFPKPQPKPTRIPEKS